MYSSVALFVAVFAVTCRLASQTRSVTPAHSHTAMAACAACAMSGPTPQFAFYIQSGECIQWPSIAADFELSYSPRLGFGPG